MANTIEEIKDQMLAEKANYTELDELNSESNTAIWRLWMFVTATIIIFFEEVMDLFEIRIKSIIDNNQYGTDSWWFKNLIAFQYGDYLTFLDNVFKYATVDLSKRIVGFCSVTSLNGVVQIKVAANVGGQPVVLSNAQLNGVVSYCSQIQPSGIRWVVLSLPPDKLKTYGNIYYDAAGDIEVIRPAVEQAYRSYLSGLNNIIVSPAGAPVTKNFDGTLFINRLVDAIQAVPGVIGPQTEITSIAAKNSGGDYQTFTSKYQPESGYFIIDPDFDLADTLTFIPYVGS